MNSPVAILTAFRDSWIAHTRDESVEAISIEQALDALKSATAAVEGWRPISEAPKDGTPIWVYVNEDLNQRQAWYDDNANLWRDNHPGALRPEPTHWMPLPEPPK